MKCDKVSRIFYSMISQVNVDKTIIKVGNPKKANL